MNASNSNLTFASSHRGNGTVVWTVSQFIVTTCTIVDLYILICLIKFWKGRTTDFKYCKKTKCNIFAVRRVWSPTSEVSEGFGRRVASKERKYRLWMIYIAVTSAAVALLKFLTDQLKFFLAWNARSDVACEVANDITEVGLFGLSTLLVYAFLWVRQWMFYHNPAVRCLLYTKHLIRFSRSMPLVIMVLSGFLMIFHFLPWRYRVHKVEGPSYLGCISVYSIKNPKEAWPIFLYIALTSVVQISLLSLFVYPLLQRKYDTWRTTKTRQNRINSSVSSSGLQLASSSRSTAFSNRENSMMIANKPEGNLQNSRNNNTNLTNEELSVAQSKIETTKRRFPLQICPKHERKTRRAESNSIHRNPRLLESVKRAVLWTALCIASDCALVGVSVNLGPGTALVLIGSLSSVNVLFNQFCIVASYRRWREIILPWRPAKKQIRLGHLYESTMTLSPRRFDTTHTTVFDYDIPHGSGRELSNPAASKIHKLTSSLSVPKSQTPNSKHTRTGSI